jgi:6-phosphofructokinase 1
LHEAQKAIRSGYVESHCCEYGIGLIRLMGRHAGFIAMEASAASKDVNVCLIPEFKWDLYGEKGLLSYVYKRLKERRTCVIVVAEGAGESMRDSKLTSEGVDASGNVKPGDIGTFLRDILNTESKKR